jgi:hypothetical protein
MESIPPGIRKKTCQLNTNNIPASWTYLRPRIITDLGAIYEGSLGGNSVRRGSLLLADPGGPGALWYCPSLYVVLG